MSCGNPYKHTLQNVVNSFLNIFTASELNSKALTDDQMECMQFGICSFSRDIRRNSLFSLLLGEKYEDSNAFHSSTKVL